MSVVAESRIEDFLNQGKKEVYEAVNFNQIGDFGAKWEEVFSLIFAHLPLVHKTSTAFLWAKSYVGRSITPSLIQFDLMTDELQLLLDLGRNAKQGFLTLGIDYASINQQFEINTENQTLESIKTALEAIQSYLDFVHVMGVADLGFNLDKNIVLGAIIDSDYTPLDHVFKVKNDGQKIEFASRNHQVTLILNNLKKEISFSKRHFKKGFECM